jgi:DNA-binding NtrC family response regulator
MSAFDRPVLLVEDDALVRFSILVQLEDAGWQVREATSVEEALSALEAGVEVSVVVTDVAMPGDRTGVDLALEIYRRWPRLGVLVISGQPLPAALPKGMLFLGKPFTQEQLTRALASVAAP